jgi:Tfp pilus assembly protein PilN
MVEEQIALTSQPGAPPRPRLSAGDRWNRLLIFGTAAAIELGERDLQAVIVRARPGGAFVTAKTTIADFRTRSPKEWGSEYHKWLRGNGERNLSSVIVLPRHEAIVRVVAMPGVAKKDIANAIGYQVDALHPYGDEEVAFGWSSLSETNPAAGNVLLGMMRRTTLDTYMRLFQEAGIPSSGFTFSASALHAALNLYGRPPAEFLAYTEDEAGVVEVYGQSAARPVFSAEFHLPPARALALARAELRLPASSTAPEPLTSILPRPKSPGGFPALAFAGALAQIGTWRRPYANLLPTEQRTVRSRARFIPTIVLGTALAVAGGGWLYYQQMREQQYLDEITSEIRKVQALANQAPVLDKRTEDHRARVKLIDDYRKRGQGFVDVMAELTRLLPPPIWTQSVEITQDTVTISGEAENAATLLKILDASPLFRNSELMMGVVRVQQAESFRIRMQRKPRK